MAYWLFELDKIPDLSLSKYMSLDEAGVDGVLKKQSSFLRQLNRKGLLSKVFFHLIYNYNPNEPKGKKLSLSLVASGTEIALLRTKELIQNSSISPYYDIISCEKVQILSAEVSENNQRSITVKNHLNMISKYIISSNIQYLGDYFKSVNKSEYFDEKNFKGISFNIRVRGNELLSIDSNSIIGDEGLKNDGTEYKYCSTLSKREFFVQPSVILSDDNDLKYYKVADWEMNDSARLYSMLKLMQGLNVPAVFRVDLFAVDYALRLREVLPIQELRNRTSMKAVKSASSIAVSRDENAEETLKQYNDLIEKYERSPHFRMNIVAFANQQDIAELIVDAAGAEALEAGSYTISTQCSNVVGERFDRYYNMDRPIDVAQEGVINYLRFMPNLFLLEEVLPFFVFPALYDGEVVELPKETAPSFEKNGLKIAVDENGYDVIFPVALFKKHAFLAGVPGSGKTNSMLHLTSSLWKQHKIPFLILNQRNRNTGHWQERKEWKICLCFHHLQERCFHYTLTRLSFQ